MDRRFPATSPARDAASASRRAVAARRWRVFHTGSECAAAAPLRLAPWHPVLTASPLPTARPSCPWTPRTGTPPHRRLTAVRRVLIPACFERIAAGGGGARRQHPRAQTVAPPASIRRRACHPPDRVCNRSGR